MTKKLPKKPGRPPRSVDPTEVAAVLAFADLHDDTAAAKRFRVSERSIKRWRASVRAGARPEVAQLVTENKRVVLETNSDLLDETFAVALKALQDKLKESTGNTLRQVAGALKIAGELKLQRDFLRDDDDKPAGVHTPGAGAEDATQSAARGAAGSPGAAGADPAGPRVH